MRSSTKVIYEITLLHIGSLNTLRQRDSNTIFFSNLKKAVELISAELLVNGWPLKINYTAVYRGVKQREFYSCDFEVAGTRVFRVRIVPRVLNPALPRLGIDENPER